MNTMNHRNTDDAWIAEFGHALRVLLVLTVVTGGLYPLLVTGIAQVAFESRANGSLIERHGTVVGSTLIGQPFSAPGYFWSRPSATAGVPYNAAASSGSNLGPSNPALVTSIENRIAQVRAADPSATAAIPVDLVTASASGLDPHISPAAAHFQVARVARARHLSVDRVRGLVTSYTEPRQWLVLGEPRVNVLLLNLALDDLPADD
jgi:potassium-transporting ATPase KdpC subunit